MATLKETLTARQTVQMQKARLMLDQAEREQRGLSADEEKAHKELLADVQETAKRLETIDGNDRMTAEINRLTGGGTPETSAIDPAARQAAGVRSSLGQQFVGNAEFQGFIKAGGHRRSGPWQSPPVELLAATLTEDPASGGDLVVPDYRPGIVPLWTRPLVVADLIMPGTTESNLITYMKETSFTNAGDSVAEGAAKPESTLIFDSVSDPVRKLATWLPCTEEILEDVPTMRSYIDGRLRHAIDLTEDDQILNGSVVAPDIVGFLARTGLAASIARGAESNADTILDQIMAIWTATGLMPTGIVMNPANWKVILKTKMADGTYYGGGPFSSPRSPILWGLPIAVTTAIVANTCLVGAFQTAAQLFRKGNLRLEVSNSHSDFFVKNLLAVRCERREALAVYRPSAFGTCTNLA
ncbi:MAG: phage major capsid protein [Vicinamibacterales bacterium]